MSTLLTFHPEKKGGGDLNNSFEASVKATLSAVSKCILITSRHQPEKRIIIFAGGDG